MNDYQLNFNKWDLYKSVPKARCSLQGAAHLERLSHTLIDLVQKLIRLKRRESLTASTATALGGLVANGRQTYVPQGVILAGKGTVDMGYHATVSETDVFPV